MNSSRSAVDSAALSAGTNLLKVDGLGCLLLWQKPRIVIAGPDRPESDVTMLAGGIESPVIIARDGEHFLVESESSFVVNGKPTQTKLLFSGDTIEMGRRGRLRFSRPVAASTSAVLQPTAAGFVRGDLRYVVMMEDSLLFGARGSHLPIDSVDASILLSQIGGQFALRCLDTAIGRQNANACVKETACDTENRPRGPSTEVQPLNINEPTLIEGLNFVLCHDDTNTRNMRHAEV